MDQKKLNILILSCNTGEGHNVAARAVRERLEAEGHTADIVDFLGLSSRGFSKFICGFYIVLAKYFPHVFGFFYNGMAFFSKHIRFGNSSVYLSNFFIAKKLKKCIDAGKYDALVFTHMFGAEALTRLKRKGVSVPPSVMIPTDYTCYPHLEEIDTDLCVLPHEDLLPIFEKRGFDPSRLRPLGIPVGMRFQDLPTREQAREALGFAEGDRLYLVMGGSMGAGHIRSLTKQLSERMQSGKIIVICGKNERLKKSLQKHIGETHPNVMILGFTTEISTYMAACDVLYTKPGGLTSTESIVCQMPMVCTKPIPGCETDNRNFFCEHGVALYAKTVGQKVASGKLLADDRARQGEMRAQQKRFAKPNAALDIVRLIETELCK